MGCQNCGSGASGKPSGCKSNGGCSSGGCNRMNVFDWLGTLPLSEFGRPFGIIEVSFNHGSRKEFYRSGGNATLYQGQWISVEGVGGFDVGQVSLTGELVKLQMKKYSAEETTITKRVLRESTEEDLRLHGEAKTKEQELLVRSRAIARSLNLAMKIAEVEVQGDCRKGTFYYTAEQRIDFRELIRMYAADFRMKVEMRQIGARQESAKVGGIGSCGRELCCSTWLTDFKTVNTAAARYQNLSINQTKLSGQCGRLKCCLNYELDTYMDALKAFPADCDKIETVTGEAVLQKRDIFRMLMWYSYRGSNKQYPLPIARVLEIKALNKSGVKPEELGEVEIETSASRRAGKMAESAFVNDVGQITLKALERNSRKRKSKDRRDSKPAEGGAKRMDGNAGGRNTQRPAGGSAEKPERQQRSGKPQAPRPAAAEGGGAGPAGGAPRRDKPRRPGGGQRRPPREPGSGGGTPAA